MTFGEVSGGERVSAVSTGILLAGLSLAGVLPFGVPKKLIVSGGDLAESPVAFTPGLPRRTEEAPGPSRPRDLFSNAAASADALGPFEAPITAAAVPVAELGLLFSGAGAGGGEVEVAGRVRWYRAAGAEEGATTVDGAALVLGGGDVLLKLYGYFFTGDGLSEDDVGLELISLMP